MLFRIEEVCGDNRTWHFTEEIARAEKAFSCERIKKETGVAICEALDVAEKEGLFHHWNVCNALFFAYSDNLQKKLNEYRNKNIPAEDVGYDVDSWYYYNCRLANRVWQEILGKNFPAWERMH